MSSIDDTINDIKRTRAFCDGRINEMNKQLTGSFIDAETYCQVQQPPTNGPVNVDITLRKLEHEREIFDKEFIKIAKSYVDQKHIIRSEAERLEKTFQAANNMANRLLIDVDVDFYDMPEFVQIITDYNKGRKK